MILLQSFFESPYKINIYKDSSGKQYYSYDTIFKLTSYDSLINSIVKHILSDKGYLDNKIVKLQNLIQYLSNAIEENLANYDLKISEKIRKALIEWITYKIIGLEKVMPFLIDDLVQEIYLDKPSTTLYIDHQTFGRCLTNTKIPISDLENLITRLCLEKDTNINYVNPSLKVELKTDKFHVRAAIDIPPLANDGISMNIRKLRSKIWTLPELIKQGMLSIHAAAYILFILKRRNNITVIGEPGSGKTTLANAIDLLTPQDWRKITVEDVVESIDQTEYNKFQTRYSVSPFENKSGSTTKSEEIIKLLHRSPTWVFLGEIQTAEHSQALFESLSAGLKGIQTCHGRTAEMMIIRWINQHNIPLSSILSLDLLIETSSQYKNWKIIRNVFRIVEISGKTLLSKQIHNRLSNIDLIDVFKYDLRSKQLVEQIDLFNTPTLEKIKEKEPLTKKAFEQEITYLSNQLNFLISNKLFSPKKVLQIITNQEFKKDEFRDIKQQQT
ncbi:MAG: ATPase, T2SS/T4P/T4SS family [Candidatus Heimdallarchaeota archaeon]